MAKKKGATLLDALRDLQWGEANEELDEAWGEVTKAVAEFRKPGSLTVTLKVVPDKSHPSQVDVFWDFRATQPTKDRMKTIFYSQPDGSLSRRDPRQPELPEMGERPRAVVSNPNGDSVTTEMKEVSG